MTLTARQRRVSRRENLHHRLSTTYVVERIDPHSERPDLTDEEWLRDTAEETARCFLNEASPQNFPLGDVCSILFYEGEVTHVNEDGVEVIARRA